MGLGAGHVLHGRSACTGGEVHAPLDAVEAGHDGALVAVRGGEHHARADEFELETGRVGAAHLGEALVDEVGGAAQLGGAEDLGLGLHALQDVGRGVDEALLGGVGHGGEDHQVAQPLQQVGDEAAGVVSALDDVVHDLEGRSAVPSGEGFDDGVEQGAVGVAEEGGGHGVRHTVRTGTREELVHDGHGVTHGALARAHDQWEHALRDRDVLLLAHLAEVLAQGAGGTSRKG